MRKIKRIKITFSVTSITKKGLIDLLMEVFRLNPNRMSMQREKTVKKTNIRIVIPIIFNFYHAPLNDTSFLAINFCYVCFSFFCS